MTIQWNLLKQYDIGGAFKAGLEEGLEKRRQGQVQAALAAYAQNPSDPAVQGALAELSPQFALQMGNDKLAAQAEDAKRTRIGRYFLNPDLNAARTEALQAGDIDIAKTIGEMTEGQRKQFGEMYKAAGGIAMGAKQLPPEQRRAYIETNRALLKAAGWTDQLIDNFDPNDAALDGIIRTALEVNQQLPDVVTTQAGGGAFRSDPLTGNLETLVVPNPGGVPMGAPVGGSPPPPPPGFVIEGGPTPSASGSFPR